MPRHLSMGVSYLHHFLWLKRHRIKEVKGEMVFSAALQALDLLELREMHLMEMLLQQFTFPSEHECSHLISSVTGFGFSWYNSLRQVILFANKVQDVQPKPAPYAHRDHCVGEMSVQRLGFDSTFVQIMIPPSANRSFHWKTPTFQSGTAWS